MAKQTPRETEIAGWNNPGSDASQWTPAECVAVMAQAVQNCYEKLNLSPHATMEDAWKQVTFADIRRDIARQMNFRKQSGPRKNGVRFSKDYRHGRTEAHALVHDLFGAAYTLNIIADELKAEG